MKIVRPLAVTDAVLTSSNAPENDYAAYNAATSYALGARVIVVAANVHDVYESLVASNLNNPPATSPTKWLKVGSTNRWRMFDGSVQSQTERSDNITFQLTVPGRADSICLFNLSAASVQIKMTDAIDGVVYDHTFSMVSDSGITDWYSWLFDPIERLADLTVTGLPPYLNAVIDVTLSASGETVKCGACVVGQSKEVGGLQYGASVGIQDYSVKDRDDFGNITVLERAYSKRANFTVWTENALVDKLHALLAGYRATPIVYIGAGEFSSTVVYGFYKDFSVQIAYPTQSICTLEIEGLT